MDKKPVPKRVWIALALIGAALVVWILQGFSILMLYTTHIGMKMDEPEGFSSAAYDTICDKFTEGGLVDYQLLKKFRRFSIKPLYDLARTGTDKMTDPKAQLAFWIDAYNLVVIRDIASKFPVQTLREVQIDYEQSTFSRRQYSFERARNIRGGKFDRLLQTLMPKAVFLTCGGSLGYPKFPGHVITGAHS